MTEYAHDHLHDHPTPSRLPSLWQAALIAGTGAMLLLKVFAGNLPLYVHTRYTPMIAVTGVVLLLLAAVHAWFILRGAEPHEHEHDHTHAAPSWRSPAMLALLVPILLGTLVPSRALGSAAIDTRGFGTTGAGMRTVQSVAGSGDAGAIPDPSQWTMLDWVNGLLYEPDNPRLQGQPIEMVGFVWRRPEMAENQFVVSRFIVSCCTADSLAIGMTVVAPNAAALETDSWVRVSGTVGLADVLGHEDAVIVANEVVPVPQPSEPYLYP